MSEYEKFIDGLSEEQRNRIIALCSTISMQAELIDHLIVMLNVKRAGDALSYRVTGGLTLEKLAVALNNPPVRGPTGDEVKAAIKEMNDNVQGAKEAKEVLDTILEFAMKVAPLVLV